MRLWHLSLFISSVFCSTILRYEISDGTRPNSYIGNIGQDAQIDPSSATFQIVGNIGNKYLKIGSISGDLRTSKVVDREILCNEEELDCTIDAEVLFIQNKEFKLFKVELKILDLNDNTPIFPSAVINLELSEDAAVGTLLRLDSATDADTEPHDISYYQIEEKSSPKYFELSSQTLPNGKIVPQLTLTRPLDYERRALHKLKLTAVDKGGLSGSTNINIRILDVNDHHPTFDQENYKIKLSESTPIGQVVFNLNATDLDSGVFGEIGYNYGTLVSNFTKSHFKLDKKTGEISIAEPLNYETTKVHNLYLEARDSANSIPAYATITIEVVNVNDNRPQIEVSFIGEPSIPSISEGAQIGDFVAFVSVTDLDKGAAGHLKAKLLENPSFELERLDDDSNRYILRTKTLLDRERISQYNLVIEAEDSGLPPLGAKEHILLVVNDENDNAPFFPHSMYQITVDENNEPGQKIAALFALDLDADENAQITYSLATPTEFFKIDPNTGDIFSTKSLDAEISTPEKVIEIIATDHGTPPLTGSTKLTITVGDLNDNTPKFEKRKYKFEVSENQPVGHLVGEVFALDADQSAKIRYRFSRNSVPFKIDEKTGVIKMSNLLDAEVDIKLFSLTVIAEDQDGKSDTAEIAIRLIDENDNVPGLIWPVPSKDIIQIKYSGIKNDLIGQMKLTDRDHGENGKVFATIIKGNDIVNLELDGTITLKRDLQKSDLGPHPILVRLQDKGQPALSTTARVNILVVEEDLFGDDFATMLERFQSQLSIDPKNGASRLAILLIAAFTALVLILIIITASIFIRHRVRRKEVYRTNDRTHRGPPGPHGDGLLISPLCNSRKEEISEVSWQVNLSGDVESPYNMEQYSQVENSFNSTAGDSGRDSGAGDSASDSLPEGRDQIPLICEKGNRVYYSPKYRLEGKPSFSTFMDESDGDSVQIIESEQELNNLWPTLEKKRRLKHEAFKNEASQIQSDIHLMRQLVKRNSS